MPDSPPLWKPNSTAGNPGIVCAVTQSPWNMALTVGDEFGNSVPRRKTVCDLLGTDFRKLTVSRQVHNHGIVDVDTTTAGRGRDCSEDRIDGADGLVTTLSGVPLMVLGADCGLIAVIEPRGRAIGVAHAGWRGTSLKIATRLVERVAARSDTPPRDLQAIISPCAKSCCYEVGRDVVDAFENIENSVDSIFKRRNGKTFLDVQHANHLQLMTAGIRPNNIESANVCTICDPRYYSYRRTGSIVGQHALIAALSRANTTVPAETSINVSTTIPHVDTVGIPLAASTVADAATKPTPVGDAEDEKFTFVVPEKPDTLVKLATKSDVVPVPGQEVDKSNQRVFTSMSVAGSLSKSLTSGSGAP